MGSVVILGGLSFVNSPHAYTFASLKRKKLISTTPLNDALNALILAFILLGMCSLIPILEVTQVIFILALKLFAIHTVMLCYTLAANGVII